MAKNSISLLTVLVFALLLAVPIALAAGEPDVGQTSAGEPDAGQTRWITPEGVRPADSGESVFRCGTDESGPKVSISRAQIDRWMAQHQIVAGGQIPVYFHVIYWGSEGNVPESQLDNQILVLNRNYAGKDYDGATVPGAAATGYTFTKAGTDRTSNRRWFTMTPGTGKETQAKNALSINPGGALNIYICKPGQNLLGWA